MFVLNNSEHILKEMSDTLNYYMKFEETYIVERNTLVVKYIYNNFCLILCAIKFENKFIVDINKKSSLLKNFF